MVGLVGKPLPLEMKVKGLILTPTRPRSLYLRKFDSPETFKSERVIGNVTHGPFPAQHQAFPVVVKRFLFSRNDYEAFPGVSRRFPFPKRFRYGRRHSDDVSVQHRREQDISLASEKIHKSIKAAIKEEKNQEGQVPSFGVQLNQRGHKSRMKARLFRKKFVGVLGQTRNLIEILKEDVIMRQGHSLG
uniref:Uncharacterized protein n=1 Tax=Tanacetum cinerariifolium TaxID=118510 RepID=A0A6L2J5R2_TANCI|nr:hypothetical protein [Tanacetum cinerariifolium]